jgi:Ca2+-binding RTX toxin-like protein
MDFTYPLSTFSDDFINDETNLSSIGIYVVDIGGNDTIFGGPATDYIDGGEGDDALGTRPGSDSHDTVIGGLGNDTIGAGPGQNGFGSTVLIYANQGDDIILVDTNGVTAFGGQGNDSIQSFSHGGNVLLGNLGDDYIYCEFDDDNLTEGVEVYGGKGNDSLTVIKGTNSLIQGNIGDDIITINNSASTTVYGGQGNDTINIVSGRKAVELKDTIIYGGLGRDKINLIHSIKFNSSTDYDGLTIYGGTSTTESTPDLSDGADLIIGFSGNYRNVDLLDISNIELAGNIETDFLGSTLIKAGVTNIIGYGNTDINLYFSSSEEKNTFDSQVRINFGMDVTYNFV